MSRPSNRFASIYAIALATLIALGSQPLYLRYVVHASNQTLTGEISASNCGVTHMAGMTARDCTRACAEQGAEYVLVSAGRVYTFANQQDKELRAHAGETVTVTGDVEGDVIRASKIEGAASTGTGR